ncbi:MAG TPA: hypothetical protein VLF63_00185 [Patescibacteria group bacterium]|nr:hypothetical protein [Patescibacteria group bacterium]
MIKHNQDGAANNVVIYIIFTLALIGSIIFGVMTFMSRQDYKNNVDSKIQSAVSEAVKKEATSKDNFYSKQAQLPLATFNGPSQYGSLVVMFPKNWSAYVDYTGSGNALVDGFFNPNFVPSITNQNSQFALRVQVINQTYSQVLQSLTSQIQQKFATASAFALPKLPNIVGVKLVGKLDSSSSVSQTKIILPLRTYTVEIWSQGNTYLSDLNNNILPNFSFSP